MTATKKFTAIKFAELGVTNISEKFVTAENVLGTYVHGIFDNDNFRRQILNATRRKKNLPPLEVTKNFRAEKQKNYERLAKIVRQNLNMELLNKIMGRRKNMNAMPNIVSRENAETQYNNAVEFYETVKNFLARD